MSGKTPVDLTAWLDETLDRVEESDTIAADVSKGSPMHDALSLAQAVSKLIDFGGGLLRLKSGHVFKLLRPCVACEVAAPMVTPGAILSKFCARCANNIAEKSFHAE